MTKFPLMAALVAVTALASAPVAQAEPEPTGWQRMLAQQPLVRAADVIQAEATSHPGYAGIVLEDDHVALWWKGTVPRAVTAAVARAETQAPVEIEQARHSNAELRAAAEVVEARKAPAVHAVKIPADGSGLVLGTTSAATARTLTPLVDVPVRTVVEEPLVPVSRQNDSPPWKGGATIVLGNAACTSGFAVRNGANQRFLLTAGHCGNPGVRVTDPTGEFIGNAGAKHADHDIMLIPTGNVVNQQYLGGGDSNTVTPVQGWGDVYTGEILCQSGVTSARETGGPVCNIKVLFFYADREDLVEGEQMNGQQAARPRRQRRPGLRPVLGRRCDRQGHRDQGGRRPHRLPGLPHRKPRLRRLHPALTRIPRREGRLADAGRRKGAPRSTEPTSQSKQPASPR